jgi:hypothetical protein
MGLEFRFAANHIEVEVILRLMVSGPVCLGAGYLVDAHDQILITTVHCSFLFMGHRPWQLLLGHASTVTLGSKSCRTHYHILMSHFRLGSLFVTPYDSQGYGGSILTCLHVVYHIESSSSYLTTDGQSASLSWYEATRGRPLWQEDGFDVLLGLASNVTLGL